MQKLNRTEFEKIVKQGIKAIPEKFLRKLDNVAIVIEAEPTPAQKKKLNPVRSNPAGRDVGLQAPLEASCPKATAPERGLLTGQADQISNGVNIHPNWTLFGLYEGVPQIERGANYSATLPDKITIFQEPIEAAARDEKDIKEIVKNTVWHEIAHHFGMDEVRVRQAEVRRRKILR